MNASKGVRWAVIGLSALVAGCLVAAAGAGAGGGIYFTSRGAEGVVPASVERAAHATDQAFDHFKIRKTKVAAERSDEGQKQEISGTAAERKEEVTVTLRAEDPGSTRIQVVARKSAVTWDKSFARAVLEQIVTSAR
ncbi:MAG: hypothetical protein DMD28_05355 [Gemmatimonadetes bacterium]|nr:MAG: hypothetical protein DMD28_05355 [Gemmatimonadota bacterium]